MERFQTLTPDVPNPRNMKVLRIEENEGVCLPFSFLFFLFLCSWVGGWVGGRESEKGGRGGGRMYFKGVYIWTRTGKENEMGDWKV